MPKSKQFRTVGSLDSLAELRQQLVNDREAAEAEAKRVAEEAKRAEIAKAARAKEADLFQEFVKDVKPLEDHNTVYNAPERPEPVPRHPSAIEDMEQSALSDTWEASELLELGNEFTFRRNGVSTDTLRKLKNGQWRLQAELDLHGLTADEAREAIFIFIKSCAEQNLRCVRIIHGKGLSSADNTPILKSKVAKWLVQLPKVVAFCPPTERDGGDGALFVLLKAPKHQRHRQYNREKK